MADLIPFACGVAAAFAIAVLFARSARARATSASAAAAASDLPVALARVDDHAPAIGPLPALVSPETFAEALAQELAEIVPGIEGGAYRMMESTTQADARAAAATNLWLSIRRLRQFHDKVSAFASAPTHSAGPTAINDLLLILRQELEYSRLGLEISWVLPPSFPQLKCGQEALLRALLMVCHALLELEPGGLRLSLAAESSFDTETPFAKLELTVEYDEDPIREPQAGSASLPFTIAEQSANNLIRSFGGSLHFEHDRGHSASARIQIPATDEPTPERLRLAAKANDVDHGQRAASGAADLRHSYGGVLVLEGDPAVRSLLAAELKTLGRAVFACSDGAAMRSLLQATPDRFELLIVDRPSRLDSRDASIALHLCPDLKVFMLSDSDEVGSSNALIARAHRIKKPFGLQDLRRALGTVLAI